MDEDFPGGGLIDVTGLALDERLTDADESALARALARILASDEDTCNGFQASI